MKSASEGEEGFHRSPSNVLATGFIWIGWVGSIPGRGGWFE